MKGYENVILGEKNDKSYLSKLQITSKSIEKLKD